MNAASIPAGEIPVQLSREQAVKVAAAEVGLRNYDMADTKATVCALSDQGVPFLSSILGGRKTWMVEFKNLNLARAAGNPTLVNRYITRLVVTLAPDTGHVLRVTSVWPAGVPPMLAYPSRAEEEEQYKSIGESFTGLPSAAPATSLLQVLGDDEFAHWSNDVKQILAYYVRGTHLGVIDRPVWVVQVRGIPPFEPLALRPGMVVPAWCRDHYRNVYDAKTGRCLEADTIPQPITPDLEKRL